MKTYEIPNATTCEKCGYPLEAATTAMCERAPREGDVGLCGNCGNITMVRGRKLVECRIQDIPEGVRIPIRDAQWAIRQRGPIWQP